MGKSEHSLMNNSVGCNYFKGHTTMYSPLRIFKLNTSSRSDCYTNNAAKLSRNLGTQAFQAGTITL